MSLTNQTYSHGTTPAMEAILSSIYDDRTIPEAILFDLSTLVRNGLSSASAHEENEPKPNVNIHEVARKVESEIGYIISDLNAAYQKRQCSKPPLVLFYWANQGMNVPVTFRRPVNKLGTMIGSVMVLLKPKLDQRELWQNHSTINVGMTILKGKYPSYIELNQIFKSFGLLKRILIFSKCPIDFHLLQFIRGLELVESFTGKIKKASELGQKVLKQEIPLSPETHIIFGDKEYLKPGIVEKEKRQRIIKLAGEEGWLLKTNDYVKRKIRENVVLPYQFS